MSFLCSTFRFKFLTYLCHPVETYAIGRFLKLSMTYSFSVSLLVLRVLLINNLFHLDRSGLTSLGTLLNPLVQSVDIYSKDIPIKPRTSYSRLVSQLIFMCPQFPLFQMSPIFLDPTRFQCYPLHLLSFCLFVISQTLG